MATKVQLLSIDRRKSEHVKRSRAEALVRRLLAVQVAQYIYQRLKVRPAAEIKDYPAYHNSKPSESVHGPRLRWEPPKDKKPLKAHPFIGLTEQMIMEMR